MFKIIFHIILHTAILTHYTIMKNMHCVFKTRILQLLVFSFAFHSLANAQNKLVKIPNSDGDLLTGVIDSIQIDGNDTNSILYYSLLADAETRIKARNYPSAINYATNAIALKPDFYKAYYTRSVAYLQAMDYKNSLQDINTAIGKDSTKYVLYYNRGILYRDTKQYELGLKDFEKTIELKNDFDYAYLYRGECYLLINDYTNSLIDFNKAIQ